MSPIYSTEFPILSSPTLTDILLRDKLPGMGEIRSLTCHLIPRPANNSLYTCGSPEAHTTLDLSARLQLEAAACHLSLTSNRRGLQIPGESQDMNLASARDYSMILFSELTSP